MIFSDYGKPYEDEKQRIQKAYDDFYRYGDTAVGGAIDLALCSIYDNLLDEFNNVRNGDYSTIMPNLKQFVFKRYTNDTFMTMNGRFLVLKNNMFGDDIFVGFTLDDKAPLYTRGDDPNKMYMFKFGSDYDASSSEFNSVIVGRYKEGRGISMLQRHFCDNAWTYGNDEITLANFPLQDKDPVLTQFEGIPFVGKHGDENVELILMDYPKDNPRGANYYIGAQNALLHKMNTEQYKKMAQLMFKALDNRSSYKIEEMRYNLQNKANQNNAGQMGE